MNRGKRRQLTLEGLECRRCFSVDFEILRHNHDQPTDVNVDGFTTPLDALSIISELNRSNASVNQAMMSDTNGDRSITPVDVLIVIDRLTNPSQTLTIRSEINSSDSTEISTPGDPVADETAEVADLINQTFVNSDLTGESVSDVLGRLRDLGLIDLGTFDLESIDWESFVNGSHNADSFDLDSIDLGFDLESFDTGLIDVGGLDLGSLGNLGTFDTSIGQTYDPTDDNGNNFFLSDEDESPISDSIEAELRKQLKVDDSASIQVAVFAGGGEVLSGTWRYLTEDGLSIWGNWRKSPDSLRLFLSNVEEENRIYGQYPDGSFLYFSWLEDQPVGFYFTPLTSMGVENPVPIERYTEYFKNVGGEDATGLRVGPNPAFAGEFSVFDGVQPIESLLRDLYAIQRKWNDEIAVS